MQFSRHGMPDGFAAQRRNADDAHAAVLPRRHAVLSVMPPPRQRRHGHASARARCASFDTPLSPPFAAFQLVDTMIEYRRFMLPSRDDVYRPHFAKTGRRLADMHILSAAGDAQPSARFVYRDVEFHIRLSPQHQPFLRGLRHALSFLSREICKCFLLRGLHI